jgi:hypothetical protein
MREGQDVEEIAGRIRGDAGDRLVEILRRSIGQSVEQDCICLVRSEIVPLRISTAYVCRSMVRGGMTDLETTEDRLGIVYPSFNASTGGHVPPFLRFELISVSPQILLDPPGEREMELVLLASLPKSLLILSRLG